MATVSWVEIWTELPSGGLRLRVLRGLSDGTIELRDPHKDSQLLTTFASYEEAEGDMLDEEFVLIRGRLDDLDVPDYAST